MTNLGRICWTSGTTTTQALPSPPFLNGAQWVQSGEAIGLNGIHLKLMTNLGRICWTSGTTTAQALPSPPSPVPTSVEFSPSSTLRFNIFCGWDNDKMQHLTKNQTLLVPAVTQAHLRPVKSTIVKEVHEHLK